MAWNQPGGNGDDPWGNRGQQQGPPDLDEVLRKLQDKLNGLFGGKPGPSSPGGGSGSGGSGGGISLKFGGIGIGVVLIGALAVWAVAGFFVVEPPERGVVLRFGAFDREVGPGLNWRPYFIDTVEIVNVAEIRREEIGFRSAAGGQGSVPTEALMLTGDENIIDVHFVVQYRVKDAANYRFNVVEPDLTVRQATESAVREIVGRSKMDFVLTEGRNAVATEAENLIQEILDRYNAGLQITSVNMQDAQPPREVQDAFNDAVKAREDEVRLTNEARAYAADILPKARGEAEAIRQAAEGYRQRVVAGAEGETDRFLKVLTEYQKAPEVTRKRLYLETVETVLSNTSKIMVDVKGGNNLLYLPLDRILDRGGQAPARTQGLSMDGFNSPRVGQDDNLRSRTLLDGRVR